MTLNKWILELEPWCPAQIYYYFRDMEGGKWCIYLRWRHQDPWTAELVRCDSCWEFLWDSPDTVDLLEEKNHSLGIITEFYYEEEYLSLMEKAIEIVEERFPNLDFPVSKE